jgi:hypothetical protein
MTPQFYALRWLMLLLCQEEGFGMNGHIRLWDTLIADPLRFTFTAFTGIALIEFVKDDVINGDFSTCMEALQGASN